MTLLHPDADGVVPHVWVGGYSAGGIPSDVFSDNVLALADRHDLTVVLSQWNTTEQDVRTLDEKLQVTKEHDIDAWLGTYDLRDYSSAELVADEEKLDEDVDRLLHMVDTYADYYPDGKVFTWHEPPNTGKWTGETRAEQAQSMVEHAPTIFDAQKSAVDDRHPDLDLGLMLWWPTAAPPGRTDTPVCGPLMDRLAERDAMPEFTYLDVYRYHFEWDVGNEAVNEHVNSILSNVKEHTDDRPVYFLADLHSYPEENAPRDLDSFPEGADSYTPSKQSLLGHLHGALDADIDSFGWYVGKHYRSATHPRNYEPFVPNVGTVDDQRLFNSVTGSRDRFVWATLALTEGIGTIDPDDCFDLWLYGHDLDFYEHAVEARTVDGDWEFLGDVSGYVDGDNPYSGGDRDRVHAIHTLERDRYLADGPLALRITTDEESDGSTLHAAYAVPALDTAHYLTEPELSRLIAEADDVGAYALGTADAGAELGPGEEFRLDLTIGTPDDDIEPLVRPAQRAAFDRLAEREADGLAPRDRFDLWVYGRDLDDVSIAVDGTSIDEYAAGQDDSAESDSPAARGYRGLARAAFLERHSGGTYLDLEICASTPATVRAVFAMPYHGTANFTPDAEIARIVRDDYAIGSGEGQLTTFATGHQIWPDGVDVTAGELLKTRLQLPHRQVRPP